MIAVEAIDVEAINMEAIDTVDPGGGQIYNRHREDQQSIASADPGRGEMDAP